MDMLLKGLITISKSVDHVEPMFANCEPQKMKLILENPDPGVSSKSKLTNNSSFTHNSL